MIADRREPLPAELPDELRGLRVLIFGLGRFGGGLGAVRFFCDRGAQVTVTDRASAKELGSSLEQISDLPVHAYQLGRHVDYACYQVQRTLFPCFVRQMRQIHPDDGLS